MSRRECERQVALVTNGSAFEKTEAARALGNLALNNAANKAPECVVCFERARAVAFVPCGHFCVCSKCGQRLDECPICRKSTRKQRIYT